GRFSFRMLDWGSSLVVRTLGKLAGGETIAELANFILSFQGMYEGFRERSMRMRTLISSDEVGFVLVTSPVPTQVEAVRTLRDGLRHEGMQVRAMVANRVRQDPMAHLQPEAVNEQLGALFPPPTAAELMGAVAEESQLARTHSVILERLRELGAGIPLLQLPELPLDAHDLDSLATLYKAFLPGAPRP